jgi:FAD/FMN-containing dehydrogenase
MIRRYGPQRWRNLHVTHATDLTDLIDVDGTRLGGEPPAAMEMLKQAAAELESLVTEARGKDQGVRALGAGWALTDIAVPRGWLINTKLLTGCFDVADRFFDATYPAAIRPRLVVAQCGVSMGQLNAHLELTGPPDKRRALKTSGIGAGQTIAGAVSGNTHGAALNFGSTPDFVVGMQLVTGSGKSLWIERASQPVLNQAFADELGAGLLRDDDVFDAALVSFGAFGIIAAVAIETDEIYELVFPRVQEIWHDALEAKLADLTPWNKDGLYHYEFVLDPYSLRAMEAPATRVPWIGSNPAPKPVWIVRSHDGFAPGDQTAGSLFSLPFPRAKSLAKIQFDQYRERCILSDVRGTPGQLFTATVTYLEGYTESAIGVSVRDAGKMIEICSATLRDLGIPTIMQVRLVHPTRALLGFTHLGPKTAVFELGLANDSSFPRFEQKLTDALTAAGVNYAFHWSKNSGIEPARLSRMYGEDRIARWRRARRTVFQGDPARMRVFDNAHVVRAGLV